jgi:protein-tyrosine phosphatase
MTFEVLVVCTGNIARSPMAQRLLQHRLDGRGDVAVSSAGTWGHEGSAMERHAAAALAEVGVGDDGFRARELTAPMVQRADLVLTATREHRVAVVSLDPQALPRTFTLREFARLVRTLPADPAISAPALVTAAAAARGSVRVPPGEDDVADPYGGPLRSYRRCREVITDAVDAIVPRLVGHGVAGGEGQPRAGLQ